MKGIKGQLEHKISGGHSGTRQGNKKNLKGYRGTGQYEHREMAAATANPV